ncbi:MAG: hypothetical protein VKJ06_05670 [Vampirovibrionales bacterium]|nr:hypothetical protein [Vampirovibrionales bacterium]
MSGINFNNVLFTSPQVLLQGKPVESSLTANLPVNGSAPNAFTNLSEQNPSLGSVNFLTSLMAQDSWLMSGSIESAAAQFYKRLFADEADTSETNVKPATTTASESSAKPATNAADEAAATPEALAPSGSAWGDGKNYSFSAKKTAKVIDGNNNTFNIKNVDDVDKITLAGDGWELVKDANPNDGLLSVKNSITGTVVNITNIDDRMTDDYVLKNVLQNKVTTTASTAKLADTEPVSGNISKNPFLNLGLSQALRSASEDTTLNTSGSNATEALTNAALGGAASSFLPAGTTTASGATTLEALMKQTETDGTSNPLKGLGALGGQFGSFTDNYSGANMTGQKAFKLLGLENMAVGLSGMDPVTAQKYLSPFDNAPSLTPGQAFGGLAGQVPDYLPSLQQTLGTGASILNSLGIDALVPSVG